MEMDKKDENPLSALPPAKRRRITISVSSKEQERYQEITEVDEKDKDILKEKVSKETPEEELRKDNTGEKLAVDNPEEKLAVDNPEEKLAVANPEEKLAVDNPEEELHKENLEEKLAKDRTEEELCFDNPQEELEKDKPEEELSKHNSEEELSEVNPDEKLGKLNPDEDSPENNLSLPKVGSPSKESTEESSEIEEVEENDGDKTYSTSNIAELEKAIKPCSVKIKKMDLGLSNVNTVGQDPGGPNKVGNDMGIFSRQGRKYMILDRNTIKGMMAKGLIQAINKDEPGGMKAAYRAVVPKKEIAMLKKGGSSTINHMKPPPNDNSQIRSPSKNVLPTVASKTSGRFIYTGNVNSKPSMTVASGSSDPVVVVSNTSKGSADVSHLSNNGQDNPVSLDSANLIDIDEEGKRKGFGVPTGVCKVLKSMKMYQYVEKSEENVGNAMGSAKNSQSVRWVAVPNKTTIPVPECGRPKIQNCTPPVLPFIVKEVDCPLEDNTGSKEDNTPSTTLAEETQGEDVDMFDNYLIQELRTRQKEQLMFHRKRYSELLMSYNELASRYDDIKNVGNVRQIVSDAKKYMKKDHLMFFRNEMLMKDRRGTGNRYSPNFMLMLMKYYNRSPVGYRFLRQIFTLPAVRTLLNWQNKSLHMRRSKKIKEAENSAIGNDTDNGSQPHPSVKTPVVQGGSNFFPTDSDDDEEFDMELPDKDFNKTVGDHDQNFGVIPSNENDDMYGIQVNEHETTLL